MLPRSAERIGDKDSDTIQVQCQNPSCVRPGPDSLEVIKTFYVKGDDTDKTSTFLLPPHIIQRRYFFESEIDSWAVSNKKPHEVR